MKLELDPTAGGGHRIDSYGAGHVVIGNVTYRYSVVVLPDALIDPWPPRCFEDLAPDHFEAIAELSPEVVLMGTGRRLRFPAPAVLAPLTARKIGVEIMDTGAVCRSFNFLAGEGRRVAAAILMVEA